MNDEIRRLTSGAQNTLALASLVAWACVVFLVSNVVFTRLEMNKRHLAVKFSCYLIVNNLFFSIPAGAIHVETVHVDAYFRIFF